MPNILPALKIGGIILILSMVGWGVKKVHDYHLDQIDKAVVAAELEASVARTNAVRAVQKGLLAQAKADREILEKEVQAEKSKVSDLRRMLLIEHDLDRLLQSKPGLILNIVNEGTEEYYQELEDITQ